jgi:hypothetical protein
MLAMRLAVLLLLGGLARIVVSVGEQERLEGWSRRGHTDPPEWSPATAGWRALMDRRMGQVERIPDEQGKWDGWMTLVTQGALVQNFTRTGFAVVDGPKDIHRRLREALHAGMARHGVSGLRGEDTPRSLIDVIEGADRPRFVDIPKLSREVLHELLPQHEAWAGVALVPAIAYGLRVYVERRCSCCCCCSYYCCAPSAPATTALPPTCCHYSYPATTAV